MFWKRSESGEYEIQVTDSNFDPASDKTTVQVQYPPEFNNVSSDVIVVEGDPSITLECIADGEPTPTITWTKVYAHGSDSVALGTGNQFVLETNRNNSGKYRCTAYNGMGTAPNRTVKVEVNYIPANVKLKVNDSVVCKGDVISITCSADGKPAVHTYQLFENERSVNDGNSSAGVWIRKYLKGGDLSYRCVANNTVGTAEKTVNVTVKVPSIVYPLENITVIEGENRTLTCNVSGGPVLTVTWTEVSSRSQSSGVVRYLTNISRKNAGEYKCEATNDCRNSSASTFLTVLYKPENVQLMSSAMDHKACAGEVISFNCSANANPGVTSYQLFENETAILNTSALGMWSKTLESEGVFVYKCVANNSLGSEYSMGVTVTVNVPSSIVQITQDQNVTEGHNVTLMCNVSGIPLPMVSWMTPDSKHVSGYKLEVININRTQAGEYKCEASNECGNATETANIIVLHKPENVQLKTSVMDNKACKGDMIGFNCSAYARPSVTSYQLFENDTAILDANPSGMWKRNVLNGGVFTYKCMANNSLGTEVSPFVMVTVNVPSNIDSIQDQNVTEGDNLTLICTASGMPQPKVSWIKLGGQRHNGDMLEVTQINRTEAGEYKCEASNECGNVIETATVDVQYKPENVQLTSSVVDNKACKGEVISFNCSANANPVVTSYQLFENESAILNTSTSGMWGKHLENKGVFVFKCVAKNSIGSAYSTSVTVAVNVPSSLQVIGDKKVFEGDNVTLLCRVSGMPSPVVSWMTPNGQRRSGYMLEVKSINRSQAGEYKCEAINECGNATKTASILVQFKLPGNPCLVECTNGRACREFGKHFCLCPKGKKGKDCKENDTVATVIMISLKINNKKWREELTDLSDLDTQLFVETITRSVGEKFKGSGVREINVIHLREGSVIADISLTFDEPVGESEVESLLLDAFNNGSLGNLKVDTFSVGSTIPDSVTVPGPVPSEPAKVNKDVIYGSVIGVLALILTVIIIFIAWKRRQREKDDRLDTVIKESREPYVNEGFELESRSGNLSTVVHHGPGHYMDLNEVRSLNEPATDPARCYLEINEYAPLHPGTRSWEVERENVTIEKVIGKGAFGQVAQGKASNLRGREETMTVAIKMLKGNATDTERKDLLSELEVMKKLKPHPHVIRLLGCVTESDPLLVLIEYVPYGDLLGYLRKSRQLEDNYFKDPDIKPQTSLTSQQLMKFSWQVADGMHYLSSKNIIHRDLAARNVLVGERERCKVTDFGMARDVCQENIYERKSKGRLPVKWTACEALLYGRYTTKSDVWSFGIVLYEIFTIGGSPYPKIHGRKMADLLTQGYRMPKPRHVDDTLYKIMQDCWQENPDDRPMFENLRNDLKEMENQHQRLINMKHYDNILYAGMD
ncbi:fibroblast growth factor receptor 4-like isoform X2 [Pocillopora verrucosa]|uniref:fibroblast growth factor receptor 4-like isoform X2 n=1 Tax=Pocillopora verrucosa TaxID=203993 RepID=UPI00333EB71B